MNRRFAKTLCVILFVNPFFYVGQARAQITITGGLDKGTKELINQLPEQMRVALLKALTEALPLIDKSVTGYLEQVNKILGENIDKAATAVQCAGVGAVKILETEVSTSLANIIYTGRRKGLNEPTIGNYTQGLADAISDTRKNVSVDTKATDVTVAYSDLLIRAAIIRCAAKINPDLLQNEIDAQIKRISIPGLEWNILIADRDRPYCNKVHECIVKRREEMRKYLELADSRDVEVSKARTLIGTVSATPNLPRSMIPFRASPIQILDYEQILLSIRQIERAVEAAKMTRQIRAKAAWEAASKGRDPALTLVRNTEGNMIRPTNVYLDNKIAVERHPEMVRLSNVVIGFAKDAVKEESSHKAASDELIKTMTENVQHAARIKASAQATLNRLESERFRLMQDQRMLDRAPK